MAIQVEHVDPYRQRYVTVTMNVTAGLQVTTEIYTPYLYGQPFESRSVRNENGSLSIEVRGLITTLVQTLAGSGNNVVIVAEGCESEIAWIEVWRSCMAMSSSRFAYTMDCCFVGTVESEITVGPAFMIPNGSNNVVWAVLDGTGASLPPGTGETNFQFIDVWS